MTPGPDAHFPDEDNYLEPDVLIASGGDPKEVFYTGDASQDSYLRTDIIESKGREQK